jgi:aspartyl protease family protein
MRALPRCEDWPVRNRLFWILLLGIAIALVILIARHGDGRIAGLSSYDFGSLAYYGLLLAFVGSGAVVMFRRQFARALKSALIWLVIALVLMVSYTYRAEFRDVYERVMAELVPGRAAGRGVRTVEIVRGRTGDFQIGAQVNGVNITMVLDTGASAVVLTQDAAKAAGLPLEVLVYDVTVETANGRTRAASVTLDRVAVGSIVERSVPALIAQPGQLRTSLMGMSFLNRLESYEVRTDKLLLRGYP